MGWVIAAILVVSGVSFFFIFFKNGPAGPEENTSGEIPVSRKKIDLSVFDKICAADGEIDFCPLNGNDSQLIKELLEEKKPVTPALLKRNEPIKIVYTDNTKEETTVRDIIPYRIIGSVDMEEGQKDYDFYIEAFCLLRNAERSFHTNGINAAWRNGKEINLGDYLAELYKKSKKAKPE